MSAPRVFISYSHDSKGHRAWVNHLATRLTQAGVDVYLDQWDIDLGGDLPRFMEQIVQTDRVLMICTRAYVDRCNEAEAGGVPFERRLMSGALVQGRPVHTFIPIMRNNPEKMQPNFVGGGQLYIDFSEDEWFEEKFWELAASIHGARTKKPPIGRNPFQTGLDAAFGSDGIQILRGTDLYGYRVTFENDFYYVTTRQGTNACVVRIAGNGAMDTGFGLNGVLEFPSLDFDPTFGHERYDLHYSGGLVHFFTPAFEYGFKYSSIFEPNTCEIIASETRIIAITSENKPSGLFRTANAGDGVVLIQSPSGDSPDFQIFEMGAVEQAFECSRVCFTGEHIYLLGNSNGKQPRVGLQRLHLDGSQDKSFGEDGIVELKGGAIFGHRVQDVVQLVDGRIIAVGYGNEAAIACMMPNGKVDRDFGDDGYIQFRAAGRSNAYRVAEQNGKIAIAGTESDGQSIHNCFVGRINPSGEYDPVFGVEGAWSIKSGRQDEFLDAEFHDGLAVLLFQHDQDATVRPRLGLSRMHID
ncbi:MAG: toll/interleukin-1 receptor domain-containing protein [Devosiaceae bacterium]